jgi:dTDP-4-amino-4,6-dideoxygalactose transaminase
LEVKLLDLVPQYRKIEDEVLESVKSVFDTQQFILGETVRDFERSFEEYHGGGHAVGTASGTDAILLALLALGIGEGDEVITTPYTFFSTVSSIVRAGAEPVLVDIDPGTYNIDPDLLEDAVTSRTGAIIVVHLFGQCAEMDPVLEVAGKRGVPVIEDACQSIGALYKGQKCGIIGDIGCFSFFPSKNLGGAGDGGMIITSREEIAAKVRAFRVHGEVERYRHEYIGINSRLDALQAAVLNVKLSYLDEWNLARRKNASIYTAAFENMEGIDPPYIHEDCESIFNQYIVSVKDRDRLREYLAENNIGTAVYYPIPLHLQNCFRYLGLEEGSFPESEGAAGRTLALPVYPELSGDQIGYVIERIRSFPG